MERPDREDMAPGDEAPPESEAAGEDLCPECGGSGRVGQGDCPTCGGRAFVTEAIGGG